MISCSENRFNLPISEDEINSLDSHFALISGTPQYDKFWKELKSSFIEMKEKTIFSGTLGAYFYGSFVGSPETTPFIHECLLPPAVKRVERSESILLSIGANNKLIHEGSSRALRVYFYQSTVPSSYENIFELVKKNIKLVEIYLFKEGKFIYSGFWKTGGRTGLQLSEKTVSKSDNRMEAKAEKEINEQLNEFESLKLPGRKGVFNSELSLKTPSVYSTEEFFFISLGILAAVGFCLFLLKKAV